MEGKFSTVVVLILGAKATRLHGSHQGCLFPELHLYRQREWGPSSGTRVQSLSVWALFESCPHLTSSRWAFVSWSMPPPCRPFSPCHRMAELALAGRIGLSRPNSSAGYLKTSWQMPLNHRTTAALSSTRVRA